MLQGWFFSHGLKVGSAEKFHILNPPTKKKIWFREFSLSIWVIFRFMLICRGLCVCFFLDYVCLLLLPRVDSDFVFVP